MSEAGSGTFALARTGVGTFAWSDVRTVTDLVLKDIEDLALRSHAVLSASLGRTRSGRRDNLSLAEALQGDLREMLFNKLIVSFQLLFYDFDYSRTEGGYRVNYCANYSVWSPGGSISGGQLTPHHAPLPPWHSGRVDRFAAVVVWSDRFRDMQPSERSDRLTAMTFRWVPSPRFLKGHLPRPQVLPAYGPRHSGGGAVLALRREVQVGR